MLDYAANGVVYWPAERLRADFTNRCAIEGKDPATVFETSLGEGLDADEFWQSVEENLRAGKVRLVFVSDEIPSELRRVIEFLNESMSPTEVLGIEIKQYVGEGDLRTLVPRLVGQTEQARAQKGGGTRKYIDVDWEYYEQSLSSDRYAIVRELYERLERTIDERGLRWTPVLKRNYLGFQRLGGYYVVGADLFREKPIEFRIKLPLAPEELRALGHEIENPYPQLADRWDGSNKQWNWAIPGLEDVPDVGPAIDLTTPYQPRSGAMPTPTSSS